jgi:hypothetical protein
VVKIYLILVPATNIIAKKMGNKIKLVPRSGCLIINAIGRSVKASGKITPLNPEILLLSIKHLESVRTRAIFIISEGCMEIGPTINHLCAPYTVLPYNKTKNKHKRVIK